MLCEVQQDMCENGIGRQNVSRLKQDGNCKDGERVSGNRFDRRQVPWGRVSEEKLAVLGVELKRAPALQRANIKNCRQGQIII